MIIFHRRGAKAQRKFSIFIFHCSLLTACDTCPEPAVMIMRIAIILFVWALGASILDWIRSRGDGS